MNEPYEQTFLLPHLMTRRNSLLIQSEVLVIESLGWFLARHPLASEAMARLVEIDGPITWQVEVPISDRARVDLLGRDADGLPRIVVEGKIHEVFDGDQLAHYARWQQDKLAGHDGLTSAFVVLGPEWRRVNGEKALADRRRSHRLFATRQVPRLPAGLRERGRRPSRRPEQELGAVPRHVPLLRWRHGLSLHLGRSDRVLGRACR